MIRSTFNRRSLIGIAAAAPFGMNLGTIRTIREQFTIANSSDVLLYVMGHNSEESAERWRRSFALEPFEGMGEWYLQDSQLLELPRDLAEMPGVLTNYDYVIGVAAAEESVMVGAFRREHIGFGFRLQGPQADAELLARFFLDQRLPNTTDLFWSDARLRALVPTTESFGRKIAPSDAFWP